MAALGCTWLFLSLPGLVWSVLKGLKMFGTIKPKCHLDWDGISPDRSISRSPSGDKKQPNNNQQGARDVNDESP